MPKSALKKVPALSGSTPARQSDDAMKEPQSVELIIPAQAQWVRVVRLVTVGVANRLGFTYDDIEDLKLAVAEACNNAVLHARPSSDSDSSQAETTVRVAHILHDDRLEILVADAGRPDAVSLPQPSVRAMLEEDTPISQLPEGGLGLLLMHTLVDEVEQVADADTHTLRLVKYLPTR